ncbi:hypothetical protein ACA910_010991 [Epithemia clementina (nom. ined.)]
MSLDSGSTASLSGPQQNYASITAAAPPPTVTETASAIAVNSADDDDDELDDVVQDVNVNDDDNTEEEDVIINQTRRYQPGDPVPTNPAALHNDDDDDDDDEVFRDEDDDHENDDEDDEPAMTIQELLYSSSSYYAIAKPVTLTMVLAALAVVFINTDQLQQEGQEAMATYQVWNVDSAQTKNAGETLAISLANALVMICVIGTMTFVIVFLYRMRCMKCLIGYMIMCSTSLLGVLGANLFRQALVIYSIPIDQASFYLIMLNFAAVGVLSVFYGKGIPTTVTQGYLVATSVILAWHLSFFDEWTAWCLLFMLALYDLCAVLSSFGPLRALVEAMSEEDAPEMPGLLFEAQLPPEAKKPGSGMPRHNHPNNADSTTTDGTSSAAAPPLEPHPMSGEPDAYSGVRATRSTDSNHAPQHNGTKKNHHSDVAAAISGLEAQSTTSNSTTNAELDKKPPAATTTTPGDENNSEATPEGPVVTIPLAIAQVYRLPVVSIPPESRPVLQRRNNRAAGRNTNNNNGAEPLLLTHGNPTLPEHPTAVQLRADVMVRMPAHGGRLERVKKRGRRVYLERDRHGNPKRILWVDRSGKVFAELRHDDDDADGDDGKAGGAHASSIRLGLGDFIFYSVLVSKAAQYSFACFAACMLVILAGLGGTLLLLAMYHQALPALPISILLGITTYLLTRLWVEPWVEAVLQHPYYV